MEMALDRHSFTDITIFTYFIIFSLVLLKTVNQMELLFSLFRHLLGVGGAGLGEIEIYFN